MRGGETRWMSAAVLAPELLAETIAIRRDLHAHPELAFHEVRTAQLVAAKLRERGLEVHEGIGGTGVVGVLSGGSRGRRSCCAPTWMRCPCPRKTTSRTSRRTPA
jgi:metal-dependent amidase/aminoacylase/carboxypeptidase family protein